MNGNQKGHNIFPGTTPHPTYYMPCSYLYFEFKKIERWDKIVFYILFKLNDHPTRCFNFVLSRIRPNGCMFELNFKKINSKVKLF